MKTTSETAKIIGVGEPTVRRWLARGLLQGSQVIGTGCGGCQIDEDSIERFLAAYPIYRVPAADRLTLNEVCGVLGLARNQRGHDMLPVMGLPILYGPEQELRRGYVARDKLVAHIERLMPSHLQGRVFERLRTLRQDPLPNITIFSRRADYSPVELTHRAIKQQMVLRIRRGETVKLLDHVICKRVVNQGQLDLNGFQLRSLQ